ncbi:hypothetical protein CR513_04267, partial [Mucuna pruriens]
MEKNRREERRERHGRRGGEPKEEENLGRRSYTCLSAKSLHFLEIASRMSIKVVRLVTLEFCGFIFVWWNQVLEEIRSDKRGPCEGWRDLKRLTREICLIIIYLGLAC